MSNMQSAAATADQIAGHLNRIAEGADQVGVSIPEAAARAKASVEAAQGRVTLGREALCEVMDAVGDLFASLTGLGADLESLMAMDAPTPPEVLALPSPSVSGENTQPIEEVATVEPEPIMTTVIESSPVVMAAPVSEAVVQIAANHPVATPLTWHECQGLGEQGLTEVAANLGVVLDSADSYPVRCGVVWRHLKAVRGGKDS